jgi:hypothetical protein
MTQWGYDDNDDNGQGNDTELNGPKALRDAYNAMKKQNEELAAQVSEFLNEQKQQKMASVFESLGVPGAQTVYTGPADPQKAKEWVESMRSVFGGNTSGGNPAQEPQAQPVVTQDNQAAVQQFIEAGQSGQPITNYEAAESAISSASDINALIQAFQQGAR